MPNYTITIYTGTIGGAGTDADVTVQLNGTNRSHTISNFNDPNSKDDFENGCKNSMSIYSDADLGDIKSITIGHNNRGKGPGWFLDGVTVTRTSPATKEWYFPAYRWLAADEEDGKLGVTLTPGKRVFHYEYLGNYPKDRENGWSEELNGVCHDKDNWFFTQNGNIWKFPITHDLNNSCKEENRSKAIYKYHYGHHLGDIDCYKNYLFVPVDKDGLPNIAVFRTHDIYNRVARQTIAKKDGTVFGSIGWLAINPLSGLLFTSDGAITPSNPIQIYKIDMDAILNGSSPFLEHYGTMNLLTEDGRPLTRGCMQGGCFDNENHLYLTNGYWTLKGSDHDYSVNDKGGITVFEVPEIAKGDSIVRKCLTHSNQDNGFRFQFNGTGDEPEGITYWNLDADKRAPGITGQLHAIMLNNTGTGDDDFYFKHYRRV